MAILSALFGLVAKKLGDILQAIFGWSITALFGRLAASKQVGLSVALALSVLWPLFVVGVPLPRAAAWVVAFLPLQKWIGVTALRILWVLLAVLAPAVVGGITFWVAPASKVRGGVARAVLNGYPLALGYALSFLLTAIVVPVLKVTAAVKRWTDTHVYVQPKEGKYDAALNALAEAFSRAGIAPEIAPAPRVMALSTKIMKFFAHGALKAIVADDPRVLRGPGVELYLYPADLLLRGKPTQVAHVRAMMHRTMLERDAYLVQSPPAQDLQDEIGNLWKLMGQHRATTPSPARTAARARLPEIYGALNKADIPYEEWVTLERMLRRIERVIEGGPHLLDDKEAGTSDGNEAAQARLALAKGPLGHARSGPRDQRQTHS